MPEEWITLRAAALQVTGKELSCVTVTRWATRGVRDIKLDYKWVGGRRHTTVALMQKFITELEAKRPSNGN